MAKGRERGSDKMKGIIKDSLDELRHGDSEFPDDPKIDLATLSGPERFERKQKRQDEVVIDGLLSGVAGKEGYFVKLKKEVRPGEYMLMRVIENDWRRWADMETEVANLVKEYTKISPLKWGTGSYRIEIACKGGMRGQSYSPQDYYINAEEEINAPLLNGAGVHNAAIQNPDVAVASRIEELSNLVNMLSGVIPKPPDPSQVQNQITQAFQQGMQMKVSEGSNATQMMTTMMTGMIGLMTAMMQGRKEETGPKVVNPEENMRGMLTVMKDFGVLGNRENQKEKTIVDFAKELQLLGIDLFKKEDPMDQIAKLKQMAGIASQFMGMGGEGEKPSILERIVDVLGPSIPKMISDIKSTAENAARVQMIAGQNIRNAQATMIPGNPPPTEMMNAPAASGPDVEPTTYQRMAGGGSVRTEQPVQEAQSEQAKVFFNQLYDSVRTNNRMFYPVIYTSLLQDPKGVELITGIASGAKNAKDLVDTIQQLGDERFRDSEFVMKALVGYVNGFIVWIHQMSGNAKREEPVVESGRRVVQAGSKRFPVVCNVCRTEFEYESEAEFLTDMEHACEEDGCTGTLEPAMRAMNH